jgi:methylated-DNA-[protein]-cysteine S-methyltransferase
MGARPTAASRARRGARAMEPLADRLRIDATDRGVVRVAEGRDARQQSRRAQGYADQARQEVREYLRGERNRFSVPLDLTGLPPFQAAVLRAILRVQYGEVITYAALAARVGRPRAARAVGNALAANPLPLIVPCHRAVRANGTWHNYGLVGPALKTRLLALEQSGPFRTASRSNAIGDGAGYSRSEATRRRSES